MSEPDASVEPIPTFDALFVREYPKMVALAVAVSGNRVFAEDIAQDALLRAEQRWTKVSQLDAPGAWLRRVTINLALSHRRRLTNELKARTRLGLPEAHLDTTTPSIHDPVWAAVAALPGKQRAVVALRYLEDGSLEEIAAILEIAPATARVHLHRAHGTLREALPDFHPTDPPTPDQEELR